jgi:hypothetical protein
MPRNFLSQKANFGQLKNRGDAAPRGWSPSEFFAPPGRFIPLVKCIIDSSRDIAARTNLQIAKKGRRR